MKKLWLIVGAMVFQGAAWAASVAPPQPQVQITAGDGSVRVFRVEDVRMTDLGDHAVRWDLPGVDFGGVRFSDFSFTYDPDPFIIWAFGAVNLTASPATFTLTFSTPFSAGPYDLLKSQLAASIADPSGSVSATGVSHDTAIDGVTLLATTMPDCVGGVASLACAGASGSVAVATAATGLLATEAKFTIGLRDTLTSTGKAELLASPVPEPATTALWLAGLLLACVAVRRKHIC